MFLFFNIDTVTVDDNRNSVIETLLFIGNSKILHVQEPPSSEQKVVGERLSHQNGDIRRSTEKLANGHEVAPSRSTNLSSFPSAVCVNVNGALYKCQSILR